MEGKEAEKEILGISSEGSFGKKTSINPELILVEKDLITLLFQGNKEVIDLIRKNIHLDDYRILIHKELASIVYDAFDADEDIIPSALIEKIKESTHQIYLSEISVEKYSISSRWEKIYPSEPESKIMLLQTEATIKLFKQRFLDIEIKEIQKKMSASQSEEETRELLELNLELNNEKRDINNLIIHLN